MSTCTTALLVSEIDTLTLGQEATVQVPHSILALLEYKGHHWLINAQMAKCQGMLCENPHIRLEVVWTLNLVTLLPVVPDQPGHDCTEVLDKVFSSRPDLTDQPLKSPNVEYCTDGQWLRWRK